MQFLIDTNVISELSKPQPHPSVYEKYLESFGEIAIASVTWHELLYGFHRLPDSKRKEELRIFFYQIVRPDVLMLDYREAAAEWFAHERARLTKLGRTPSYADGQIAAIAAVNNLVLVTRNVSDYAHFSGLRIENWFS